MNASPINFTDLPDRGAAARFLEEIRTRYETDAKRLESRPALLSDVLTLVSYSPLIAATLLQHREYIWWLDRKRRETALRTSAEIRESLARFALTNSTLPPNVLFARFRRRELIRIFLADVRRLFGIAEITEAISNLADAIIDAAARHAEQEFQNRFGVAQEQDERGRIKPAQYCVVALGKLGSLELNYSSDIDLLFLYSGDGTTSSATADREPITNREYFGKLVGAISKLLGGHGGEGAAYRVDLRLRPHGSVGPLAISVADAVRYYRGEAQDWERQTLIRSRSSAGKSEIFRRFFAGTESSIFRVDTDVGFALDNVRRSKQKIDRQRRAGGIDVKLGRGGIREIEFIAQALQISHGGRDRWLRAPHTLIGLTRLSDRGLIGEAEVSELHEAYEFLRRLEHVLQMENGLQTHTVPQDETRRRLLARRMRFEKLSEFDSQLKSQLSNVHRIFERVFGGPGASSVEHLRADGTERINHSTPSLAETVELPEDIRRSLEKSDVKFRGDSAQLALLEKAGAVSRKVGEAIAACPSLINHLPQPTVEPASRNYEALLTEALEQASDFRSRLARFRRRWSELNLELLILDAAEIITPARSKFEQTRLAEASLTTAIEIASAEMSIRLRSNIGELPVAILGLGKLGSCGIDFESDLDLIITYETGDESELFGLPVAEFYSRFVELFVATLSSMTREGSIYRVDLRLRPHGRNGSIAVPSAAFYDYVRNTAAIWEMLALVKLRPAGGNLKVGQQVEKNIRQIIFSRAKALSVSELAAKTVSIRHQLQQRADQKSGGTDFKYAAGGMLDVYFAVRFLQLCGSVFDAPDARSTGDTLAALFDRGLLSSVDFETLSRGYKFLSILDHSVRLTLGRTTRLPHTSHPAAAIIAKRIGATSAAEMLEHLHLHRLEIRRAFERILDANCDS